MSVVNVNQDAESTVDQRSDDAHRVWLITCVTHDLYPNAARCIIIKYFDSFLSRATDVEENKAADWRWFCADF